MTNFQTSKPHKVYKMSQSVLYRLKFCLKNTLKIFKISYTFKNMQNTYVGYYSVKCSVN